MLLKVSCLLFLAAAVGRTSAEGTSVRFHNCKSLFDIKKVEVDPCPGGDTTRCPLKKGTSPRISVTFVPTTDVTSMSAKVYGIVATIPTEFPLPNADACVRSGLTCPLRAGQEYTYNQTVTVESHYPNIQLLIRWTLDDETPNTSDKKNDVCFIIRGYLVD